MLCPFPLNIFHQQQDMKCKSSTSSSGFHKSTIHVSNQSWMKFYLVHLFLMGIHHLKTQKCYILGIIKEQLGKITEAAAQVSAGGAVNSKPGSFSS